MGFRPSPFLSRNSKKPRAMLVVVFYCETFLKEKKTIMTNKLETPLSKQDLGSLFSQKVDEVTKSHFYIRTKTHNSPHSVNCSRQKWS